MAHTTPHHSPRWTAAHKAGACVRAQAMAVMAVTLRHWQQATAPAPMTPQG